MAMRWRVTASEWEPNRSHFMNRDGAKRIDKEENRRKLTANELNGQIGARGGLVFVNSMTKHLERQLRHVGAYGRWKGCLQQMLNISGQMLDHTSLEQVLSVKNNTQNIKITMIPEGLPGDPEMCNHPVKQHNRLCWAALAYCNMHCDGSAACQSRCKIKKLLDNSCSIEDAHFEQLVPHLCKYNMVDIDWDEIREV